MRIQVLSLAISAQVLSQTPAALFSEIGIALEIALDPKLAPSDAERAAITYTSRVRKLLYDASLNTPLDLASDQAGFEASMNVFLQRDSAIYTELKQDLGIKTSPNEVPNGHAPRKGQPARKEGGRFCLRYGAQVGLCKATEAIPCGREHACPFCDGQTCQHKEGYLERHLGNLAVPLSIQPKRPSDTRGKGGSWRKPSYGYRRDVSETRKSPGRSRSGRRVAVKREEEDSDRDRRRRR